MEAVPLQVYGNTLDELEHQIRCIMRLDGFEDRSAAPGMQVGTYALQWYDMQKRRWKEKTRENYKCIVEKLIVPGIGHMEVSKLTGSDCDSFLLDIEEASGSGKARKVKSILKGIMQSAVRDRLRRYDPVCTKLGREEGRKRPFLETDQIGPFLEAAENHTGYRLLYEFLLCTGCRPAEGAGMTWDRIDEDNLEIFVDRQLQRGEFTSTKTSKSREVWAIDEEMFRDLICRARKHQEAQKEAAGEKWSNPLNLVFTDDFGGALAYRDLREGMVAIREVMGIDRLTMYSLRHTYASHTYAELRDLDIVGMNMGHERKETTLIYVDVLREDKERYRERMSGYWGKFIKGTDDEDDLES